MLNSFSVIMYIILLILYENSNEMSTNKDVIKVQLTTIEKGRHAFIWQRAKEQQEKSRHRNYVPGYFTTIDAIQRMEQYGADTEESSSATDSIERARVSAYRAGLVLHRRNASHGETHFRQGEEKSATRTIPEQGRRLARNNAIKETIHKRSRRDSTLRKLKAAAELAARNSARSALFWGCGLLLLLISVLLVLSAAGALFGGSADIGSAPVSDEVKSYAGLIQAYAMEHGIPEYTELIMAVMMQESGGRGSDPMQASECAFNTKYPKTPGGITDPEYSINIGIQNLADCLSQAGTKDPADIERISLALQGYNFGSGYISWALANYGGYSELNAIEFSEIMARRMGWTSYGDPQYVQHVLRYYSLNESERK